MNPLSFTISDVNGSTVISGGIINDPNRFEDDDDLMDYAYVSSNGPTLHVDYTSFMWDVGDGDVEHPSDEEIRMIRSMYEHHDPDLVDHLDFIESGSYELSNPAWTFDENDVAQFDI